MQSIRLNLEVSFAFFFFFLTWNKVKALSPFRLSASHLSTGVPPPCSDPPFSLPTSPFSPNGPPFTPGCFSMIWSSFQVQMRRLPVMICVSRAVLLIPSCLVAKLFSEPTHELTAIQAITDYNSNLLEFTKHFHQGHALS